MSLFGPNECWILSSVWSKISAYVGFMLRFSPCILRTFYAIRSFKIRNIRLKLFVSFLAPTSLLRDFSGYLTELTCLQKVHSFLTHHAPHPGYSGQKTLGRDVPSLQTLLSLSPLPAQAAQAGAQGPPSWSHRRHLSSTWRAGDISDQWASSVTSDHRVMFNLQKSASRISSFNEIQVNICSAQWGKVMFKVR